MIKSQTGTLRNPALDQILPGVIVAATFLLFAGTISFDFVFDDRLQILQNPYILSWRFLPHYFTSNVWSFRPGMVSNYYRPLFFVWLRLNEALFGLQPAGWHLTSVLMHLLVTLEVYLVGERLLPDRRVAAVAAALFAVHPVHTESVAWVSGITDPLMAALMLASLLAYFRFRDGGAERRLWFAASLILYALATLTKETALIFPIVIFAYEWIFGQANGNREPGQKTFERLRPCFVRATAYVVTSAAYLVLRRRALGAFSLVITPVSVRTMLFTWPSLFCLYAQKIVWPFGLSPFYDTPYVRRPGVRSFLLPGIIVALTVGLFWLWARIAGNGAASPDGLRESRMVAFSSAWVGLPFLTLLNLSAFLPGEIAKDRYLYIPSIGVAWLAAMGWRHIGDVKGRLGGTRLSGSAGVAACLALGTLTMRQNAYWSNDLLLYTRACAIAPRNAFALGNMAITAYSQGYPRAALKLYQRALEADPTFERLYYDKAVTELDLGQIEDSDRDLSLALSLDPADASALFALGKVRDREGRLADSVNLIRHALKLNPDAHDYHFTLGSVLEKSGNLSGALQEFGKELASDPSSLVARHAILRVEKLTRPAVYPVRTP
jgi:hypothetical protein